jgi:hypothetical protein
MRPRSPRLWPWVESAGVVCEAVTIHRGDPGYASKLDRDGDGIGCE